MHHKHSEDIVFVLMGEVSDVVNLTPLPLKNTRKIRTKVFFGIAKVAFCIVMISLLCFGIRRINCFAEITEDLQFRITTLNGEEMEVTCINFEKKFYEALNPGYSPIWTIDGFMPAGYNSVRIKTAIDTHNTSETYPDLYYSYGESEGKATFHINQVSGMFTDEFCKTTNGVFELTFYDEQENSKSYFIILDGNPCNYAVAASYQGGEKLIDYFSDSIDLVDPDTKTVLYNIYDKSIDSEIYPQRKLYQKIDFTKYNSDSVAIKMSGNHSIPSSFTDNTKEHWIMDGEKYYRINGGNWIQFSEDNDDRDVISPNLELETGDNLVEICQLYKMIYFGRNNESNPQYFIVPGPGAGIKVLSHVLLIHCDDQTSTSNDSNTDILHMKAYSWAQEKGDLFLRYKTNVNETDEKYSIFLNQDMKYTPVILSIDTVNPGAKWAIEDETGQDISVGRVGHYTGFDSDGRSEIYLRVTSADGKKTSLKKVLIIEGEASSKAELTRLSFNSDEILLKRNGELIEKTDDSYVVDSSIKAYTVCVNQDSFEIGVETNVGAEISVDGEKLDTGQVKTIHPKEKGISEIVITASDGMTKERYYLLYDCDGEYPYFGVSETTRQLADSMLTGFKNYLNDKKMDIYNDTCWMVYMARSIGYSLDGAYVPDITSKNYNIVSDYASAALELIIIGENPYDFNGINYIQETENALKRGDVGAWNTSMWALIAFKAAGYSYPEIDDFTETIKGQAQNRVSGLTWSIDTSSWAWEAVKDEFSLEDQAEWAEWIHNVNQRKTGDAAGIFEDYYYQVPNSNTHGCVLSALNALNIDPEKFTVSEGKSPLLTLRDEYMVEDGKFKYDTEERTWGRDYNKDIIIALGDIVSGESLWDRISINSSKLSELLVTAQSLVGKGDEQQNIILQQAINDAEKVEDITKEGKVYFDLLDAVRAIDSKVVSTSRMCSSKTGAVIDKLITDIDSIGEVTVDNAEFVLSLKEKYESLSDSHIKRYVTNYDILSKAVEQAQKYRPEDNTNEKTTGETKQKNRILKVSFKSSVSSIKLNWTSIDGIDGFQISRYDKKTKKYKKIASLNASKRSFTVKRINGVSGEKLKSGTKYTFKISAFSRKAGEIIILKSNKIVTATCPKKIALLMIKQKGKRKLIVKWEKSSRCSGYEVWAKEGGGKYKRFYTIKRRTIIRTILKKLKRQTKYVLKIRPYVSVGKKKTYGSFSKSKTIHMK